MSNYSQAFSCFNSRCQAHYEKQYEVGSHIPIVLVCEKCGKETAYAVEGMPVKRVPRPLKRLPVKTDSASFSG